MTRREEEEGKREEEWSGRYEPLEVLVKAEDISANGHAGVHREE